MYAYDTHTHARTKLEVKRSGVARAPERRAEEREKRRDKDRRKTGGPVPAMSRRPEAGARDVPVPDKGMERFRIEVGYNHGVKPGNIVGAIANEAEIDAEYIGRIDIYDDHATVDMPEGMPREIFKHLKGVWVSGQRLQISRLERKLGKGGKAKARKRKK